MEGSHSDEVGRHSEVAVFGEGLKNGLGLVVGGYRRPAGG